ncbi:MAG: hypothetical protein KIT45_14010 [Fimbriimonadia bacterium]|nr:hypothetical protein [Fimbriimonadia bacterium]
MMNRRERVLRAVRGEAADRLPFSFWYHFRTEPWFPKALQPDTGPAAPGLLETYIKGMSQAELGFWNRYQPDLLKVMHDIPYEMPVDCPQIESPDDWTRLPELDPDAGHFGAQLQMLRRLRAQLPADVPMIETVFNVFYYAHKMCGKESLSYYADAPEKIHIGLKTIQRNLLAYVKACLQVCDGIYFAVNGISEDTAPRELYERHIRDYDLELLESAQESPLNVLHVHGYGELYADLLVDAPAAIICWSDRACTLSLKAGKALFGRCVMGGLNEKSLPQDSPEQIEQEARDAFEQAGTSGFILAPGCAVDTDIAPERLMTIRSFAERQT